MTKEQKIDMLLAFLAPIILAGKYEDMKSVVQVEKFPDSQLPVEKKYTDNPLKELLKKIVDYNYRDERKNWEECCLAEGLINDDETDLKDTYNPDFCSDHIYHTIHQLQELIDDCKQVESSSNNIVLNHKRLDSELYRKIQEEAKLGYKYLLVYHNKKEMEKALDGKIYAISAPDGTFLCDLLETDFLQLQDNLTIIDSLSMPEGVHYYSDWVVSNEGERRKVFSRRLVILYTNET